MYIKKRVWSCGIGIAIGLVACGGGGGSVTPTPTGDSLLAMMKHKKPLVEEKATQTPHNITTRYEMEAHSTAALLDELHSGVLIRLMDGCCDLGGQNSKLVGGWYAWQHVSGGMVTNKQPKMLLYHDLDSIHLRGDGQKAALLNQIDGATVLVLQRCKNVVLDGVAFQNLCSEEQTTGGGLVLLDCERVFIENCKTTGYHAFAIEAYNSKDIHLYGTTLQGCHHQALKMEGCERVFIKNVEIKNNTVRKPLMEFNDCIGVEMEQVKIYNNLARDTRDTNCVVLSAQHCQNIQWKGGTVEKNTLTAKMLGADVRISSVKESGNYWQK